MAEIVKGSYRDQVLRVNFDSAERFASEYHTNIKAGGLFVEVDQQPPMLTHLAIHLQVGGEVIELSGQVVWANPTGVGIQFQPLTQEQKLTVKALLSNVDEPSIQPEKEPAAKAFQNGLDFTRAFTDQQTVWQKRSLFSLFREIAHTEATGQLTVEGPRRTDRFRLQFCRGLLLSSTKYLESRDVGLLLRKEKILTDAHYKKAISYARSEDLTVGEAIVKLGFAKQEVITSVIQARLAKHQSKIVELEAGQFLFTRQSEKTFNGPYLEMSADNLVFRGLMHSLAAFDGQTIKSWLESKLGSYPLGKSSALVLGEAENRLWADLASGAFSINSIVARSPFKRLETYRYLLALVCGDWLQLGSAPATRTMSEVASEIDQLAKAFHSQNHFEQLAVHWSHPPSLLSSACKKRKICLRSLVVDGLPAEQKRKVQEMLARLEKVMLVLTDKAQRRKYRDELVDGPQRRSSAQILFQKAQMAIIRDNFKEAHRLLESCHDVDPKNPAYVLLLKKIASRA